MGRRKVKYRAIGECPLCGQVFIRPAVCSHAICTCSSAVEVPLHPAVILPSRLHARIKHVADLAGVSMEDLTNALLLEGAKAVLKGKKVLQYRL